MSLEPHYTDDTVTLYHGDCVEVMRALPDASVDAVVTDPPYGLEFMGKEWDSFRVDDPGTNRHRGERAGGHGETDADRGAFGNIAYGGGKRATTHRCVNCGKRDQFRNEHACGPDTQWRKEIIDPHAAPPTSLAFQEWSRTWALEALRVLKPGGHLLAFGGTRTWHRLACAIEDAGFEVRDSIAWMYGSGFPKSLDVSKAIDKAAGATREPSGAYTSTQCDYIQRGEACPGHGDESSLSSTVIHSLPTAPATPAAQQWQGWGTALKPAFEPIVVARKPLAGTVAANVLAHGTGALNIDGCRIGTSGATKRASQERTVTTAGWTTGHDIVEVEGGRWPANVILDESQAQELDRMSGTITTHRIDTQPATEAADGWGTIGSNRGPRGYDDTGGASRFFYTPKADSSERPRVNGVAHPTVKPLDLMRYLVRLVTPPGGVVLEPFAGSGTTIEASIVEGFRCVAIEREPDYIPLILSRITKPIEVTLL